MTLKQVRARYHDGVLEPLDDIDLSEDEEVLLTVAVPKSARDPQGLAKLAGAWAGQFDDFDQLIRDIYQARIDGSREPPTP